MQAQLDDSDRLPGSKGRKFPREPLTGTRRMRSSRRARPFPARASRGTAKISPKPAVGDVLPAQQGASDRAVGPPKVEIRASEKTRSLKPTPRSDFREPGAFGRKTWSTASENRQPLRRSDPRRRRRSRPSMTARPAYCTFRAYLGRTPATTASSANSPCRPPSRPNRRTTQVTRRLPGTS